MLTLAELQALIAPIFPGLLGIQLVEASAERVVADLPVRAELCTTGGILHGGAYMAFADTLGALATVQNLPAGARTTTIESKTNFIGSARVGSVVQGVCTPVHRGRTTMVWTTQIIAADGKLCAQVTQTQMVLPAKPGG